MITVHYRDGPSAKMDSEFFPNFPYVRERLPGCPTTPVNKVENPTGCYFPQMARCYGGCFPECPTPPPPKSCHSLNFLLQTTTVT